jgi:diguanylate cyclase (GGDEF)-like protein
MSKDHISLDSVDSIINNIFEAAYFVNTKRKILNWNRYAEMISGFSKGEVIRTYCHANILNHVDSKGKALCKDGCPLHETIDTGTTCNAKVYLHHKEGHRVPVIIRTVPVFDEDEIVGAVEFFKQDSEQFNFYEMIKNSKLDLYLDQKNDIPNRRYVEEKYNSYVNDYKNNKEQFAILLVDIDDLSAINEKYSRAIGDEIIYICSQSLVENTEMNDVLCMWDSQDYVGLFKFKNSDDLKEKVNLLTEMVNKSCLRNEQIELCPTVSVGVVNFVENETLHFYVNQARKSLNKAKASGKNSIAFNLK